jgi:hypothetical protein
MWAFPWALAERDRIKATRGAPKYVAAARRQVTTGVCFRVDRGPEAGRVGAVVVPHIRRPRMRAQLSSAGSPRNAVSQSWPPWMTSRRLTTTSADDSSTSHATSVRSLRRRVHDRVLGGHRALPRPTLRVRQADPRGHLSTARWCRVVRAGTLPMTQHSVSGIERANGQVSDPLVDATSCDSGWRQSQRQS